MLRLLMKCIYPCRKNELISLSLHIKWVKFMMSCRKVQRDKTAVYISRCLPSDYKVARKGNF